MLKRTPFYDFHVQAGAKMVDFAGWEMPLLYRGIVEEHVQTRAAGSVFDVSHMGRLHFSGRDAEQFVNHVLTRDVSQQKAGQSRYSLICNASGGILDDVIVSRFEKHWLIVCNASNRQKLLGYFDHLRHDEGFDVTVADQTESTAMIAIQGPKVIERLEQVVPVDLRTIRRYYFQNVNLMVVSFSVFRSGYTGEDGVEVILPASLATTALQVIDELEEKGLELPPAGLGARDTLRLEAGMPLYGHELTEQIDPISAGLEWAVSLEKQFVGAEALRRIQAEGPRRRLVGLELEGRRIARQGSAVMRNGQQIGEITSGTFGPTVQKSIAMAYVDSAESAEGNSVAVDLKGTAIPAKIVKLPFYKR